MPLFYQDNINEHTKLAVWKISEQEAFFSAVANVQREIAHPQKRLQHLAGRYLLLHLFPGFPLPLIQVAGTRKPFLADAPYRFSISHTENYAAAIVSTQCNVGIDAELVQERITAIRHKFLSEQDAGVLFSNMQQAQYTQRLTTAWSAKEAVYKWYGRGEIDFKKDIVLDHYAAAGNTGTLNCTFSKAAPRQVCARFLLFGRLVLAWIAET